MQPLVFGLALGLALGGLAPGSASANVGSWSLTTVDNQPPFFDPARSVGVACPSTSFCIALGVPGRAETTTNPTGPSTAWQAEKIDGAALDGVSCASSTLCVAVDASGGIVASTNPAGGDQAWHTVATDPGGNALAAVSCPSSALCVAVDIAGNALASTSPATSGSWSTRDIDGTTGLEAISCPSANFCAAVDSTGNAITSSDPGSALPSWSTHAIDAGHPLSAISCVGTALCVAGDNVGNDVTSTDPASSTSTWTLHAIDIANVGLTGISCPSTSLCVISDFGGRVLWSTDPTSTSPTAFTVVSIDTTTLYGIACPAENLCVAVDSMGNALSTTTPTGAAGAWAKVGIEGTTRVDQGTCVTTTFCVVPDRLGRIVTSTNPTGGTSAWHAATADGTHQIFDVSCPTENLCVGSDDSGDVVTSTTPLTGPWTVTNIDGSQAIHGVSCPTETLCVAVDTGGGMLWSTNPAGGGAAWSTRVVIDTHQPGGPFRIDCPTIALCVAVDESGHAVTSTDPTGGAGQWTTTGIDGTNAIYSLQCASASLCIAGDSQGNVVTTTNPTGPASDWHVASIDSSNALFGVACPSTTLCVAAGNEGELLQSSDPGGGAGTWSYITQLPEGHGFLGLMCPSATLCVAPGYHSDIAVGTGTPASVVTGSATAITGTTATLNGTVNPHGSSVTDCHFDYGTSSNPYQSAAPCAQTVGSGTGTVAVSADVTGLTPNATYHFRLVATAGGGTVDGADANFPTPAVAPEVSTSAPSSLTPTSATLNGQVNPHNSTVSDCHFAYGTTGPPYAFSVPCAETVGGGNGNVSVSAALSGLQPDTTYHFSLQATSGGGSSSTPDATFSSTAIDTVITGGPDGPTNDPTPTFTFAAVPAQAGATFACAVDHVPQPSCSASFTTAHLADGAHFITVQASTAGGVQDPSPAERDFFVDTVAPQASIAISPDGDMGSRIGTGETYAGYVSIGRSVSDPAPSSGVAALRCVLDPASAPASYDALPVAACPLITNAPGDHTVYAAAVDSAGNQGPIVVAHFTVVGPPDTTITGGPSGATWDSTPSFTFVSTVPGSTFMCRIDGDAFAPCSSPLTTGVLGAAGHSLQVEAISPEGVVDPTPARRLFSVAPVETHAYECHVQPYTLANPHAGDSGYIFNGCSIEPAALACSLVYVTCVSATVPCPVGARCTLRSHIEWSDADPAGVSWTAGASAQLADPRVEHPGEHSADELAFAGCQPAEGANHCSASGSAQLIGSGAAPYLLCDASAVDAGNGKPTNLGDAAARSLTCDLTMQIEAAPSLAVATAGQALTTYVPGAGVLSIAAAGPSAHGARVAAQPKPRARPPFKAVRRSAHAAGPVTIKLTLSPAAQRTLKRKKRLALAIRLTFTPTSGKIQARTVRVTLRPVAALPKRPKVPKRALDP